MRATLCQCFEYQTKRYDYETPLLVVLNSLPPPLPYEVVLNEGMFRGELYS